MPPLMTKARFEQFKEIQNRPEVRAAGGSNIFVPWAGEHLIRDGGLYYVGVAKNHEKGATCQRYEDSWHETRDYFSQPGNSPFWYFLKNLTERIFRTSYDDCLPRLGWSNLFKIGHSRSDDPRKRAWTTLKKAQSPLCRKAFASEVKQLKKSVILIATDEYFRIPPDKEWNKQLEECGIHFCNDGTNMWVNSYHPRPYYCTTWGSKVRERALHNIALLAREVMD